MTPDDLHRILTDLHTAQQALAVSGRAFDAAIDAAGDILTAIRQANDAQGHAIDAVIAATARALALVEGRPQ